jgi:hypothetical protein
MAATAVVTTTLAATATTALMTPVAIYRWGKARAHDAKRTNFNI